MKNYYTYKKSAVLGSTRHDTSNTSSRRRSSSPTLKNEMRQLFLEPVYFIIGIGTLSTNYILVRLVRKKTEFWLWDDSC